MQNIKTKKELARRAVKIFPMQDYADRSTIIHQRKGWLRSVLQLGSKWILAAHKNRDTVVFAVCMACVPFACVVAQWN
jgi:hypothetical protein